MIFTSFCSPSVIDRMKFLMKVLFQRIAACSHFHNFIPQIEDKMSGMLHKTCIFVNFFKCSFQLIGPFRIFCFRNIPLISPGRKGFVCQQNIFPETIRRCDFYRLIRNELNFMSPFINIIKIYRYSIFLNAYFF